MKKFEVGKVYYCRSLCDYDCKWFFKILSRTEKMMTIQMVGYDEVKRVKIHSRMFDYCESAMPLGRYSMAPVLTAEKVA